MSFAPQNFQTWRLACTYLQFMRKVHYISEWFS